MLSDILTYNGDFGTFTRSYYRKEGQRDLIQKLLFEQGDMFLVNEMKNPQKQVTNTLLNSCIFGTRPESGSTVANFSFNKLLVPQNKDSLRNEMAQLAQADEEWFRLIGDFEFIFFCIATHKLHELKMNGDDIALIVLLIIIVIVAIVLVVKHIKASRTEKFRVTPFVVEEFTAQQKLSHPKYIESDRDRDMELANRAQND